MASRKVERYFRKEEERRAKAEKLILGQPLTLKRVQKLLGKPLREPTVLSQQERDKVLDEILARERTEEFMRKLEKTAGRGLTTSRAFYARRFYYTNIKDAVYKAQSRYRLSLDDTKKLIDAMEERAIRVYAGQWKPGLLQTEGWAVREKFRRKTAAEMHELAAQKAMARYEAKTRKQTGGRFASAEPEKKEEAPAPKAATTKPKGRFRKWASALAAAATAAAITIGIASHPSPIAREAERPPVEKTVKSQVVRKTVPAAPDKNLEKGKAVVSAYENLEYQARRTSNPMLKSAIEAFLNEDFSTARAYAMDVTKSGGGYQPNARETASMRSEAARGSALSGGKEAEYATSNEDIAVAAMIMQESRNRMAERASKR